METMKKLNISWWNIELYRHYKCGFLSDDCIDSDGFVNKIFCFENKQWVSVNITESYKRSIENNRLLYHDEFELKFPKIDETDQGLVLWFHDTMKLNT